MHSWLADGNLLVILNSLLEVPTEDIYRPAGKGLKEVTGVGVVHCRGASVLEGCE